jgi:hypothetical protein
MAQEINLPDGVIAMNIFYFEAVFQDDQADEAVISNLEVWVEALYDNVKDELSDQVSLGEFVAYTFNTLLDRWDNFGTGTPTLGGTETTSMLPHGVAGLVRAYSTNPRSIARKYIPGFGEIEQADGTWLAGALTAMAGFGHAWSTERTISANNDLVPAVFDTTLKIVHQLNGTEVVLAEPAYQRRRRPGVGI